MSFSKIAMFVQRNLAMKAKACNFDTFNGHFMKIINETREF